MLTYLTANIDLPKSIINPLLLDNLKEIYEIRSKVMGENKSGIFSTDSLDTFNNFSDGRGVSLMKALDQIYNVDLHKKFPVRQYEIFNTSFLDSLSITSVLEGKILVKEINELISTFEKKEKSVGEQVYKVGRSNGAFFEIQAQKMYSNWKEYLLPFVALIEEQVQKLHVIPLGSEVNIKIENSDLIKEIKEKEKSVLAEINKKFIAEFTSTKNRINAFAQMSQYVDFSGTLNSLATVLMKIANDVRFLSSGPRSGYGELTIPENEPGSSIMPGKVNPTQCESLTMVSGQVIGNHTAISIANSSSLFESNSFKPLIANNILRSLKLLADGIRSFNSNCAVGIELIENPKKGNF